MSEKSPESASATHDEYVAHTLASYERGDAILDAVYAFLGRFVAYPDQASHDAHVLWIGHTHAMDCWDSTARMAFLSPEPGSGKSRALEVTELLVPNPVEAINVTPAYLFRKVGGNEGRPTLLYDEIDTVFGPRAKDNEEIRGLLNAGHRKHAFAGRCVVRGKQVFTEEIPAYCAVAMAGLGSLPDTILSRAIIVPMRRRGPSETIEPFRRRLEVNAGFALRDRLGRWAATTWPDGRLSSWPEMPSDIQDRDGDIWEALFSVADAAAGHWPARARAAAVTLVAAAKAKSPSLGVRLLADLRRLFGDNDSLPTDTILSALHELDEAPWGELRGKPLSARGLSRLLHPYGVQPKPIRRGELVAKGYKREDLSDPWARYLPRAETAVTSVTAVTTQATGNAEVTDVTDVTVLRGPRGEATDHDEGEV